MTRLIDADELRRRIVESLDYHDRESSVDMDGWKDCKAILDAMPVADCKTCDDDEICLHTVEFVGGMWRVTSCSLWAKR